MAAQPKPKPYVDALSTLLLPSRMVRIGNSPDDLECSLHVLPKPLMREFTHVFNHEYLKFGANNRGDAASVLAKDSTPRLLAIPTNQHAREDLVAVGDQIEREKDRLLNVFLAFGKYVCEQLRAQGYWADYIDPCSGLPMISLNCNKVYSEVDGMECLLNYKAYNAGFCKILTHPKWGSAVYPATIFAHAPVEIVMHLMESLPAGATA